MLLTDWPIQSHGYVSGDTAKQTVLKNKKRRTAHKAHAMVGGIGGRRRGRGGDGGGTGGGKQSTRSTMNYLKIDVEPRECDQDWHHHRCHREPEEGEQPQHESHRGHVIHQQAHLQKNDKNNIKNNKTIQKKRGSQIIIPFARNGMYSQKPETKKKIQYEYE